MKSSSQNPVLAQERYIRNVVLQSYLAATKERAFRAFARRQLKLKA